MDTHPGLALDPLLLQITTHRKKRNDNRRGAGAGSRDAARTKSGPYQRPAKPQQQQRPAPQAHAAPAVPVTDKLVVSNLAFSVTERDVRELFSQVGGCSAAGRAGYTPCSRVTPWYTQTGPIKSASLNYDKDGKSKGVANVIFHKAGDANKAVKEYHGRTFDNRPMRIELIFEANAPILRLSPAVPVPRGPKPQAMQGGGKQHQQQKPKQQQQQQGQQGQGKGPRGRKAGPKEGKARGPNKTAEELDAEMDVYMNDAVCDLVGVCVLLHLPLTPRFTLSCRQTMDDAAAPAATLSTALA
jgi:THO complex subunit 4